MHYIFTVLLCSMLMTGCAQSMTQHSNMVDAMNRKLTPINYTKTYIFSTFGYPDSKTSTVANGVRTEVWTYKTKMGKKDTTFVPKNAKTRYMKITLSNNLVTDVTFE